MSLLLYSIFRYADWPGGPLPKGVGEGEVSILPAGGLGAAVSRIEAIERIPDLARVQSYRRVVEALFEAMTIIPMRYGNVFETPDAVVAELERSAQRYRQLLDELSESVEMGIRAFWPDLSADRGPLAAPTVSGKAYLLERRTHYALAEEMQRRALEMRARCERAFEGLYRKMRVEELSERPVSPSTHAPVLSLYFLIPRQKLAAFRSAFRTFTASTGAKCLLSGPWPPYTFAA